MAVERQGDEDELYDGILAGVSSMRHWLSRFIF
jgi:hypothetical protein